MIPQALLKANPNRGPCPACGDDKKLHVPVAGWSDGRAVSGWICKATRCSCTEAFNDPAL